MCDIGQCKQQREARRERRSLLRTLLKSLKAQTGYFQLGDVDLWYGAGICAADEQAA